MCVSHSCSMGWDLFQVTQKGGKRAVPAGEMRSRIHVEPCPWCLSGALSAPCVGAHWPCLPALVLVSSYLLLVHLPLALMAKLLTATLRQAGPKMRIRTLLMLTLTVTLAKKPSALAWAPVLSPLAIEHSSTWSSWKRQSRWAPGSDLFTLVLCSQVEAEQPVSAVLGWGDVNNPVSLATAGSLIAETQGYLCSWCSGLPGVSGCGSTLLFLEKMANKGKEGHSAFEIIKISIGRVQCCIQQ